MTTTTPGATKPAPRSEDERVATAAAEAAAAVDGVYRLGTAAQRAAAVVRATAGGRFAGTGVRLVQRIDGRHLEVSIIAEYPVPVKDLAARVRDRVADAVAGITSEPTRVDVTVVDVHGPFDPEIPVDEQVTNAVETAKGQAASAVAAAGDRAADAADTVRERAADAADTVRERAAAAAEAAQDRAAVAADRGRATAEDVQTRAADAATAIQDRASDAADTIQRKAAEAADTVQEQAAEAADAIEDEAADAADQVEALASEVEDGRGTRPVSSTDRSTLLVDGTPTQDGGPAGRSSSSDERR